jgi:hypothetical protein
MARGMRVGLEAASAAAALAKPSREGLGLISAQQRSDMVTAKARKKKRFSILRGRREDPLK